MCGICGIVDLPNSEISNDLIKKMTDKLEHRGPDDEGYFEFNNIGLGHRRLSIIDLNTGHQPILNEDNNIVIVFNGEIYNFQELENELKLKGHIFKTKTDTEVIIHLYEEYGYKCLDYLRGMFAFAIYNKNNKELFLARDRFGQKPLYYAYNNGIFYFASEIKSIIADSRFKKNVNYEAIHHYLSFKYVPHDLTAFENIHKLPHGSYLVYKDQKVKVIKYWKDWFCSQKIDDKNFIETELKRLLTESVKLRMISDVPLGAFLSGGIDSSIIVALMSNIDTSKKIKTFSIGFEEKRFDETYYADLVAKQYNTEHYKFIVKPDALKDIDSLIWHYNEPFADASMLPTYYLSRETRKYVKVALSGDAGDENFAGYLRYLGFKIVNYIAFLPLSLRKIIFNNFLKILPVTCSQQNWYSKFHTLIQICSKDYLGRYLPMVQDFSESQKRKIYSNNFIEKTKLYNSENVLRTYFTELKNEDYLHKLLFLDMNTYLPDDLMVKTDIASMAVSLECRAPLLDHKLVEFISRIPSKYKLHKFTTKYIFKNTFKNLLPPQLLNRNKMGFGIPMSKWFRGELKKYITNLLTSSHFKNRGLFCNEEIKKLLDNHINRKAEHGHRLWSLMCLELWFRKFID